MIHLPLDTNGNHMIFSSLLTLEADENSLFGWEK
jgi:hypothetical protein